MSTPGQTKSVKTRIGINSLFISNGLFCICWRGPGLVSVLGNSISAVTDFNDYLYYNTTPSVCNFRDKAMSVTPSKSAAACFSLLNIEVSTGTSTSTPTGPIGHD
jgi:hypothetical protein